MTKSYNTILIKIKDGKISPEKLRQLEIPNYQKIILLVACYQAMGTPKCQIFELLNIAKSKNTNNKGMLSILSSLKKFINNGTFDILYYRELLDGATLDVAEEVEALTEENTNDIFVQELDLLLMREYYQEVIRLCGARTYYENPSVQKRQMEALIKLGRLNDAIKIGIRPCFKEIPSIQALLVKLLIELGYLEEAFLISTQECFLEDLAMNALATRANNLMDEQSSQLAIPTFDDTLLDNINNPQL